MGAFNTITVEVDLDDVKWAVLANCSVEDLKEALEEKEAEYVADFVNNPTHPNYFIISNSPSQNQLYRHLCDLAGCGYCETKEKVLEQIKDKLL